MEVTEPHEQPTREQLFAKYQDLTMAVAEADELANRLLGMGLMEEYGHLLSIKQSLKFTQNAITKALLPTDGDAEPLCGCGHYRSRHGGDTDDDRCNADGCECLSFTRRVTP